MKKSTIFAIVIIIALAVIAVVATYNVAKESTKKQVENSLTLVVGEFKAGNEPTIFKVGDRQIYDQTGKTTTKVPNGTKIACICENDGSEFLDLIDWYPFIE